MSLFGPRGCCRRRCWRMVPHLRVIVNAALRPSQMPRADGRITTHALGELQARGTLFVRPQEDTYNGMVIGESTRESDMEVRPLLPFFLWPDPPVTSGFDVFPLRRHRAVVL